MVKQNGSRKKLNTSGKLAFAALSGKKHVHETAAKTFAALVTIGRYQSSIFELNISISNTNYMEAKKTLTLNAGESIFEEGKNIDKNYF